MGSCFMDAVGWDMRWDLMHCDRRIRSFITDMAGKYLLHLKADND